MRRCARQFITILDRTREEECDCIRLFPAASPPVEIVEETVSGCGDTIRPGDWVRVHERCSDGRDFPGVEVMQFKCLWPPQGEERSTAIELEFPYLMGGQRHWCRSVFSLGPWIGQDGKTWQREFELAEAPELAKRPRRRKRQ